LDNRVATPPPVAVIPLVLVFLVASQYPHTIPTTGNDLVLIGCSPARGCCEVS
jgi:hypothetical protein